MQAVILCGGRGQRLMPLTAETPAPLLRICCKEILRYNIEYLKKAGFDKITLALGYKGEMIKNYLKGNKKLWEDISLDLYENPDMGTSGAISYAFNGNEDNILVINGNGLYNINIEDITDFHRKKNSLCTVVTKGKSVKGNICLSGDKNNLAVAFAENPSEQNVGFEYFTAGIYLINKELFHSRLSCLNENALDFESAVIPTLVKNKKEVYLYKTNEFIHSVVTPEDFLECQNFFLENQNCDIISYTNSNFSGVKFISPVCIGKNVIIEKGSIIENSVIDDGSCVMAKTTVTNSYVGENAVVSKRCELYSGVICKGAVLENSVKAEENSLVGEGSIVGGETEICKNSHIWPYVNIEKNSCINMPETKSGRNFSGLMDEEGGVTIAGEFVEVSESVCAGLSIGSILNLNDLVITGRSTVQGAQIISQCINTGINGSGVNVYDIGECTLPMLIYALSHLQGKLCVYSDYLSRGRITILAPGGVNLKRKEELAFRDNLNRKTFRKIRPCDIGQTYSGEGEKLFYKEYINSILPESFENINADIRTNSVISANISDDIFPIKNDINGEKIVFNISCGGKKASAYTEKTGSVTWERLVCLCCDYIFEKGLPVALPYVFPQGADSVAEDKNGILYRYYNSPLDDYDFTARVTSGKLHNLFTVDGLILCALVCKILSQRKLNLQRALKDIPHIYSTERFVCSEIKGERLAATYGCDLSGPWEGFSLNKNSSRVIVRPVKNSGGFNIFSQSANWETASSVCDDVINRIKFLENADNIKNENN